MNRALAMNLQLLESVIASHISRARQACAWRFARPVIGWFAVCLFATAAFALDPEKAITQFVQTAWAEKEGAPPDIRALTQSKDGYLWLGTLTCLFSFDGIRFARFEPRVGEDLPVTPIQRLLATRDGTLWIVFLSGSVSRLLHGHVISYSEREGSSHLCIGGVQRWQPDRGYRERIGAFRRTELAEGPNELELPKQISLAALSRPEWGALVRRNRPAQDVTTLPFVRLSLAAGIRS